MKIKKYLLSFTALATASAAVVAPVVVSQTNTNANAYQWWNATMTWEQRGSKPYGDSRVTTDFTGTVGLRSYGIFWQEKSFWRGVSKARWYGNDPAYNSDIIKHTISIWLSGIGSSTFTVGSGGLLFSTSFDGTTKEYTYQTRTPDWRMNIDYSYLGWLWGTVYVGQKVSSEFVFGNNVVIVDSEVDQVLEKKGSTKGRYL